MEPWICQDKRTNTNWLTIGIFCISIPKVESGREEIGPNEQEKVTYVLLSKFSFIPFTQWHICYVCCGRRRRTDIHFGIDKWGCGHLVYMRICDSFIIVRSLPELAVHCMMYEEVSCIQSTLQKKKKKNLRDYCMHERNACFWAVNSHRLVNNISISMCPCICNARRMRIRAIQKNV